jgi:hypothetical protein
LLVDSIPPKTASAEDLGWMLRQAVRELAFELRLPWKVKQLFEAGKQGIRIALDNNSDSGTLGLTPEQLLNARIRQEIGRAGSAMQAQAAAAGETQPPSEREMDLALEVFDIQQWRELIESFDQVDAVRVRSYVEQNADDLRQRFGVKKLNVVRARATMRGIALWLKDNRSELDPITDAYWAVVWKEQSRFANTLGKEHPPRGRSLDEATSERNTARNLSKRDEIGHHDMSVSAYKVKQWRRRWRELPFEEYDGDFLDYLVTIYYAKDYTSYLRRKGSKSM